MPACHRPVPAVPGLFVAMDPPDHTRLRRKLIGAFTVKRMKLLEEQIVDIAERQLDELARLTPPVDLVGSSPCRCPRWSSASCSAPPTRTARPSSSTPRSSWSGTRPLRRRWRAYGTMTTYLSELVTRKRAEPGDDILSDLARDDDLALDELTGAAFLLLLAGHETTASLLALGTFALLEHPEQLAALRTGPAAAAARCRRRAAPLPLS